MIALVQRVAGAQVVIGGAPVGAIGRGALVFVCAEPLDTPAHAERLVSKLLALRIFADADGKMNLSLRDTGGGLLLVSQFTLAADTTRGNRPGFSGAAGVDLGVGAVLIAPLRLVVARPGIRRWKSATRRRVAASASRDATTA
ncbi:MAG TPA: D-aminoacyl-tRNA deacylase [Rubrivivax sp.]|nr:D-aminoacyl-tRNA deacylase [Rubrivivax sp.]